MQKSNKIFKMTKEYYAILSGACAASASIFGKLSGSSYLDDLFLVRVIFFAFMVVSNAFVWMLLVKALQKSSSITAITISTGTNYLVSGICGCLLFGELTFLLWCLGTIVILCGLMFILSDEGVSIEKSIKSE